MPGLRGMRPRSAPRPRWRWPRHRPAGGLPAVRREIGELPPRMGARPRVWPRLQLERPLQPPLRMACPRATCTGGSRASCHGHGAGGQESENARTQGKDGRHPSRGLACRSLWGPLWAHGTGAWPDTGAPCRKASRTHPRGRGGHAGIDGRGWGLADSPRLPRQASPWGLLFNPPAAMPARGKSPPAGPASLLREAFCVSEAGPLDALLRASARLGYRHRGAGRGGP